VDDGPETDEKRGGVIDALPGLTDEELKAARARIDEILAAREKERKAEVLKEIQHMAKEVGLRVGVIKQPPRKRGRPPKEQESPA
jgi:hypothetical protein